MKVVCGTHEYAHEIDKVCPYCEDSHVLEPSPRASDRLPATIDELFLLAYSDPDNVVSLMDGVFGTSWRSLSEKELTDVINDHYSRTQLIEIDYADFATVTND